MRALKIVLWNVLLLFALLGAIEVGVRIFTDVRPVGNDPTMLQDGKYGTSYGYRPDLVGHRSFGEAFDTDRNGFRSFGSQPQTGPTLLLMGDSVTVGVGVPAEATFTARLLHEFPGLRFVNAGVEGYSASDYAGVTDHLLRHGLDDVRAVVVGLCLNDFSDRLEPPPRPAPPAARAEAHTQEGTADAAPVAAPGFFERALREWRAYGTRFSNPFARAARIVNDHVFDFNTASRRHWLTYVWIRAVVRDASADYYRADREPYERNGVLVRERLSALRAVAEAHGVPLVLVVYPWEYQLRSNDFLPQDVLRTAAAEAGVELVDLSSAFQAAAAASGRSSKDFYLYGDPMHLSALGHEVVAEALAELIREKGWSSTERRPAAVQPHATNTIGLERACLG